MLSLKTTLIREASYRLHSQSITIRRQIFSRTIIHLYSTQSTAVTETHGQCFFFTLLFTHAHRNTESMADWIICDGGVKAPDRDILAHCVYPGWCSDTEQNTHILSRKGVPQIVGQGCLRGLSLCMDMFMFDYTALVYVCVTVTGSYQDKAQAAAQGCRGHTGKGGGNVGGWLNKIFSSHIFPLSFPPLWCLYLLVISVFDFSSFLSFPFLPF